MKAIQFKIIQRRFKFRNPNHWLEIPKNFQFCRTEIDEVQKYLDRLIEKNIHFTYPGHQDYPESFYRMKEPPLFLEYKGEAIWKFQPLISVIGSRQISELSKNWMKKNLSSFLRMNPISVVSGGALGVDQMAHLVALKNNRSTVVVLPTGLESMYPKNLVDFDQMNEKTNICFLSEFESNQPLHKSHFYFRNRLIAALGNLTLIIQASMKSGSLLTVHHCLENGKPVLVIPAHPEIQGFDGNLKLIREGAFPIANEKDLLDFWNAEINHN